MEVELVGYVDANPQALRLLREEFEVPPDRCFDSVMEAVVATHPEAVLVTTALAGHEPVTRAALEADLHVLVEKPFAPSLGVAEQLVDLAAANGLVLMVSQNYRFHPAPRALAALVNDSKLGQLHGVSVDFRRNSPAGPGGPRRHHLEDQPLLADMAIHHFDLLRLILSREPERIYCEAWNPVWTAFNGPPAAVASIVFEGGVVVSYRGSWVSAGLITSWAGEWRMEFEDGEVVWTGGDDGAWSDRVTVRPRKGRVRGPAVPVMARTGTRGTLTEFADAVQTGREPETSGRRNLGTVALMEAAVESATRRQPVVFSRTGQALAI
jgi:predicted dehydrogenase